MNYTDAFNALRDAYSATGLGVSEDGKELIVNSRRAKYRIHEADIDRYCEYHSDDEKPDTAPNDCSLCGCDYREALVFPDMSRRRSPPFNRRELIVFGEQSNEDTYAEFGPASEVFCNHFRLASGFLERSIDRIKMTRTNIGVSSMNDGEIDIRELLSWPFTIRVHNIGASSVESALTDSTNIIEGCIFDLAYLRGIAVKLGDEWPQFGRERNRHRRGEFEHGEEFRGNELPFPRASLNPDIVRFYIRGAAADDAVTQFLAFYQVSEYFFVRVTDEQLYGKLSRRINDSRFTTTPTHLDRIIHDVLEHDRVTDETEMLKAVIGKYVDERDLIEFITAYEEFLEEKHFTKKRWILGKELQVSLQPGHVFGSVARRVKHIRNALVHSSDRHERTVRHIPQSADSEKLIEVEVPLIKHLSERVIIATAGG